MSEHSAIVTWKRKDSEAFTDNQYSRAHTWEFDGGSKILASASPHVVPVPLSVE
ncbi:TPA: OsmC family peroxiredoxin, partial [Vibrio cholerae]|nr:OsmC family peroxiredoxin [Vibrio cholerae]